MVNHWQTYMMHCSWNIFVLAYFCIFSTNKAHENQMKIGFIRDYLKFEQNTRFLLYICFPIGKYYIYARLKNAKSNNPTTKLGLSVKKNAFNAILIYN